MTGDTPYRIRPVGPELLDAAWQLRLRALREDPIAFGQVYEDQAALSPEAVRTTYDSFWTHRDNRVFLAVSAAGDLAGMIGVARLYGSKQSHCTRIWGMYVAREHRGQGLGPLLVNAAIGYCRSLPGVLQVHLDVMSVNSAARRLYKRAGFVHIRTTPRADIVDGTPLDLDSMVLMLDGYPVRGVGESSTPRT